MDVSFQQKGWLCLFSQPQRMCQVLLSFNLYIDLSQAQISSGGIKGIKKQGANVKCRCCFRAGIAEMPGEGAGINPFSVELSLQTGGELLVVLRGSKMWKHRSGLKSKNP